MKACWTLRPATPPDGAKTYCLAAIHGISLGTDPEPTFGNVCASLAHRPAPWSAHASTSSANHCSINSEIATSWKKLEEPWRTLYLKLLGCLQFGMEQMASWHCGGNPLKLYIHWSHWRYKGMFDQNPNSMLSVSFSFHALVTWTILVNAWRILSWDSSNHTG